MFLPIVFKEVPYTDIFSVSGSLSLRGERDSLHSI